HVHLHLHSIPTRRSSDLTCVQKISISPKVFSRYRLESLANPVWCRFTPRLRRSSKITFNVETELSSVASPTFLYLNEGIVWIVGDRKSTRLNSSHQIISY